MPPLRRTRPLTVNNSGTTAGSVLCGSGLNNQGLRLRVLQEQIRGNDGAITGRFLILDIGDNMHSHSLRPLLQRATDAQELLGVIRLRHPGCVNVANANILALEQTEAVPRLHSQGEAAMADELPRREPGNQGPRAETGRPPGREEGTVSDPDQYATEPLIPPADGPPCPNPEVVSDPDF